MADANELLRDVELDDDVKSKIVSVLNPVLSNYETSLDNEKNKLKEAIQTRDTVKEKNRELEAKIATGNTQIEELLGAKNKEIETVTTQLNSITQERDALKTFTEQVNQDRKKELIEKVPEGKLRESLNKINDLSILREQVDAILENIPNNSGSFTPRGGKGKINTEGKNWDDFNHEQRKAIREQNKSEYERMYKIKFGRLPQ